MHRQFITYQGRPLVVGEEDDLLTIPEPGIEVNEILGSEEVTEKIAEDVQAGDHLYRSKRAWEDLNMTYPYASEVRTVEMFKKDGDLYCGALTENPRATIYKLNNGKWEIEFMEGYNPSQDADINSTNEGYVNGSFLPKGEKIYITETKNHDGVNLHFAEYENGLTQYIQGLWHEPNLSSGYYLNVDTTKLYEFSGQVHYAIAGMFDGAGSLAGNVSGSCRTFIFDESTRTFTTVPNEVSGDSQWHRCIDMCEADGNLLLGLGAYATAGGDPNVTDPVAFHIKKWNSSTSAWEVHQALPIGANGDSFKFYEFSSGVYLSVDVGDHLLYKYNTSTTNFDLITTDSSITCRQVRLFEGNDTIYKVATHSINYNTEPSGLVHTSKYDFATSSWTDLSSWVPINHGLYEISPTTNYSVGGSQAYHRAIDVMHHDGNAYMGIGHAMTGDGARAFFFGFYEFDFSNETWRDMYAFPTFATGYYGASNPHIDVIDFSGQTFMSETFVSENYGVYLSSVDAFDRLNTTDIDSSRLFGYFIEDDNKLYSIGGRNNQAFVHTYEYTPSSQRFMKLATSLTAPANINHLAIADLSGTKYVIVDFNTTSPTIGLYTFSSGVFTEHTPASGFPNQPAAESQQSDIIAFNNELYAVTVHNTATDSDLIRAYKYNGSTWDQLGTTFNNRTNNYQSFFGVNLVEYNDELHALVSHNYNPLHFKYNTSTSSFDEQRARIGGMSNTSDNRYSPYVTSKVHDGSIFVMFGYEYHRDIRKFNVFEYDGYSWKCHPLPSMEPFYNYNGSPQLWTVNGDLYAKHGSTLAHRFKLLDYRNETVWYKKPQHFTSQLKDNATGIALESGSKGDTIKIRKVKR